MTVNHLHNNKLSVAFLTVYLSLFSGAFTPKLGKSLSYSFGIGISTCIYTAGVIEEEMTRRDDAGELILWWKGDGNILLLKIRKTRRSPTAETASSIRIACRILWKL